MSFYHSLCDKLEVLLQKTNEILENKEKGENIEDEMEEMEDLIEDAFPEDDEECELLANFTDKLEKSDSESEEGIFKEFSSFEQIKKNALIKMLELGIKKSQIAKDEDSDPEKQIYLLKKLKEIC